ncbi:MAG: Rrf2 family transcriptional regulator [Deltaproteobacteria bacterium]|nr:Rrf2 family transcriptional regulator [Deltaproteobacteria bacterium]
MKLSTKTRYGTRFLIELAALYTEGPVQTGFVAERQGISVKYLEQIIVPLRKANLIKSIRGRKGGHMLARPPEEINMGEVLEVLEEGMDISGCINNPSSCKRSAGCKSRDLWEIAATAMYNRLNSLKLSEIIK